MRVVKELPLGDIKATIFYWNNKYLLKLEQGLLEQTFKVPETEISGEQDLEALLTEDFLNKARLRFRDMMADLQAALF
ncbi:hypothetical protein [Cesiribacter andamanensis]|uniref:Recombination-associated protein RdgC n=1 Tax=Cesiribacter andamanensis AMV16 TaxID=1279009 RepID=M7N480_9BACT|nr:hypothetical protein [Cesiribacter andamanensis]EMR02021.1 hypothetical protein ADICEAN_02845 [Cesiribacter andamanensis AMV16]